MLRSFAAFAFLIVAVGFAAGQPAPKAGSKTPAPKTSKTPKATAKGKAGNEPVEGYKKQTIEGFTVLVNDEVFAEGTEKYARKPLDVLALELGMVAKLLTPKAVETLRRLTIWVEWDEKVSLTNGREGFATAVYYGGSQASVWKDGLHPLKAGNITVLSLKSLTEEHQPKTDSGRCVLLHEMAHAVHYQLLGQESPALKAAYQQAMQRHLYEKERYLCTNEVEFFAEATCAYFNQLDYFPRTRDDLRSHDDVTYKALDAVWGSSAAGRKPEPAAGRAAKPAKGPGPTGADKYDLGVKLTDVTVGDVTHGPPAGPDDLAGRVVVAAVWGRGDTPLFGKLAHIVDELGAYGVRVVAAPGPGGEPAEKADEEMKAHKAEFSVVSRVTVKEKAAAGPLAPPQCLVFAADGTCVFRGSAYDALPHARAAVARKLLAAAGGAEPSKAFKPAADALTGGDPLTAAIPKVAAAAAQPGTAAEAKPVLAALTGPANEALAEAQKGAKASPLASFLAAERLAVMYKGTAIAAKADALRQALRSAKPVQEEMKARKVLVQLQQVDATLAGQPGSTEPNEREFQERFRPTLDQMKATLDGMKKKYPSAPATADAERLCKIYGVS